MQRIVILGAGESGTGAAVLAKQKGFDVFVSDKGLIKKRYKEILTANNITWEEEKHTEALIYNANEVIKSPGIADKQNLVVELHNRAIPVISEIEFAARYTNATLIAITGSNGKTTTTLLTYHILKKAGFNVGLAGNIGKSFAMLVATESFDYYVLEISSFQLDGMYNFRANIAVLLNITPDHLDRYNYNLEHYINSKFKITNNQTPDDAFIFSADDIFIVDNLHKKNLKAREYPFSLTKQPNPGAYINNGQIIINTKNLCNTFFMTVEHLALQGNHNIYNSMASAIAARILEVRKESVRESLADFQNIEHRLEFVSKVHGVEFINDSKATNVNSTWYALETMRSPVVLILGGQDKGNDYASLIEMIEEKVKAIICLGIDNSKIIKTFAPIIKNIIEVSSAEDAVKQAYHIAKAGDTVLLSPACASFDLFHNYEDRGNQFKEAVRNL